MSLVIASFIAFAQAGVPVATVRQATPASVTLPEAMIKCRMDSVEGASFEIQFLQTGGRGYLRSAVREGAGGVGTTPVSTMVTFDTTGRYQNMELSPATTPKSGWIGAWRTTPVPGAPFRTQFESKETTVPGRVSLEIQPNWPLGSVWAVGFCQVQESQQQPLTDAEATEIFAQ